MRLIVVGGSASGVGKTTLAAALIRSSSAIARTVALKVCVKDAPCETAVLQFDRIGSAEHRKDSDRLLDAGASTVVWVTVSRPLVRSGLAAGLRAMRALCPDVGVIESTSAGIQMRRIDQSWFIAGEGAWKPWARRHHDRADRILSTQEARTIVAQLDEVKTRLTREGTTWRE